MSDRPRLILLGHISAAQGLRGEVLLKTHTGAPKAIASYGALVDETGTRTFELKVVRVTDKGVVARIAGVEDRTAAEKLKGTQLYVSRDRLPAAAASEYYHADLVGLDAVSVQGESIGHVVAVQNFGAGDLLEIRLAGTIKTELLPFTDACVPEVDVAGGRVVIRMPDMVEGDDADEDGEDGETIRGGGDEGPADGSEEPSR